MALACLLAPALRCLAEENTAYADALFGDWGGRRTAWRDSGYDWQAAYKVDMVKRLSDGGPRRAFGLDNLDVKLSIDGQKAFAVDGGRLFLYVLSNHGSKPGAAYNRLPYGVDNIETPVDGNTTKIFQLYWDQSFLEGHAGLLFGLFDLNSEFYSTESSAIFFQPTFGIGADMGASGRNGPSIFPTTSLAVRLRWDDDSGFYGRGALFDGVPGDPSNPHGTHVDFGRGDGTLAIAEAGFGKLESGRGALGVWRYSSGFPDFTDVDATGNALLRRQQGIYFISEKRLRGSDGQARLDAFFRLGHSSEDTLQISRALSFGVVCSGLFAGHDEDESGIGYADAHNSEKWRSTRPGSPAAERSLEFVYRHHAVHGIIVEPTLQYLFKHGTDPSQGADWYAVIRMEVNL
jgi:porin